MMALFLGMHAFFNFKYPRDLLLAFSSCWLTGIGGFLIVRRNLPMSKMSRMRFTLNIGLCAGFLVFAVIPNFVAKRATSSFNPCVNNLRQIDAAATQFALEHHLTEGAPINFPNDLTPYIKLNSEGRIPSCPEGGIYHISKVGETPTCSLGTNVIPMHVLY
jgi:hypothetical protein